VASALIDGAGKIVETRTAELAATAFSRQRIADYQVGVVTGSLPPGWYLFRISAATEGHSPVTRDVTFHVQ
jgi:hypothetical protein